MLESSKTTDSTDNPVQDTSGGLFTVTPTSPPDQASIQSSMDKNKETLKRKLMLRRSVNELVDQGIYPSLRAPPAFADKTRQLERAKTGDLLRHKIQQRPNRQLLVQQHILEDTNIDPSLHERQRLLKRSRLLDDLNDKLSHRPGPLDLVQENILQPSLELANAIRDGTIQFVSTSDTEEMDQSTSPFTFNDGCVGSSAIQCPSFEEPSSLYAVSSPSTVLHAECLPITSKVAENTSIPVAGNSCPSIPFIFSAITPPGSISEALTSHPGANNVAFISIDNNNNSSNSSNNNSSSSSKSRAKKPKPKVVPKSRMIKFHEYKGPPSAVKSQSSHTSTSACSSSVVDTPYNILLQQQQLFLQLQLEFQQRQQQQSPSMIPGYSPTSPGMQATVTSAVTQITSPPIVQPSLAGNAALIQAVSFHKPQVYNTTVGSQAVVGPVALLPVTAAKKSTQILSPQPIPVSQAPPLLPQMRPVQSVSRPATKALTSIPTSALSLPKLTGNLEEMKVADLKAELKKRCLPVSGSKPHLIERLKPFTDSSTNVPSPFSLTPKSDSRPSSRLSTPLQFHQATDNSSQSLDHISSASMIHPDTSTTVTCVSNSSQNSGKFTRNISAPTLLSLDKKGGRSVASIKPLTKDDLIITTTAASPVFTQAMKVTSPRPLSVIRPTAISLASSLAQPTVTSSNSPLIFAHSANNTVLVCGQNNISGTSRQALASMTTDRSLPTTIMSPEMVPVEVASVSLSHGHQTANTAPADTSVSMDTHVSDENVKNFMETSFDVSVNKMDINPVTSPLKCKVISLGSSDASSSVNVHGVNQNLMPQEFQTNMSTGGDISSYLGIIEVPVPQQSSTQTSQFQQTTPHDHTVTSPTSLLQLQQLHFLQQLQQQLMQQTQVQQQLPQEMFQQPLQSSSGQMRNRDQVVLAQAKQIEELQRQLQESHLRLELHQQQQQQNQQQKQQQLMQKSLLNKISQNQQPITPLVGHVVTSQVDMPLQPLPSLVRQRQQQKPLSVSFSNPELQQTPTALPGSSSSSEAQAPGNQALMFTVSSSNEITSGYSGGAISSRTTQVPSSPLSIDSQTLNIHRCSSAPYISGQFKEPPYYHEAIRQKQRQIGIIKNTTNTSLSPSTECSNVEQVVPSCKSQAMDDVLEILIRSGELPLNAAMEDLPAPKQMFMTDMQQTCDNATVVSHTSDLSVIPTVSPASPTTSSNLPDTFQSPVKNMSSHNSTIRSDQMLSAEYADTFNKALLNDAQFSSSKSLDAAGPSSPFMNEDTSNSVFSELLDWGEMPSAGLPAMDFSVEFGFDQLYLGDSDHSLDASIPHDSQFSQEHIKSKLEISPDRNTAHLTDAEHSHSNNSSDTNMCTQDTHRSRPHPNPYLSGHCNESITSSNQMDTSEWLDIMIPNSF